MTKRRRKMYIASTGALDGIAIAALVQQSIDAGLYVPAALAKFIPKQPKKPEELTAFDHEALDAAKAKRARKAAKKQNLNLG